MKRELLLGLSRMCVPNDCRLEKEGTVTRETHQGESRMSRYFTLSTPALRIEFPFLFHLSANMGPLCCPKVLARFPNGQQSDGFV